MECYEEVFYDAKDWVAEVEDLKKKIKEDRKIQRLEESLYEKRQEIKSLQKELTMKDDCIGLLKDDM